MSRSLIGSLAWVAALCLAGCGQPQRGGGEAAGVAVLGSDAGGQGVAALESGSLEAWRAVARWSTPEERRWEPARYDSSLDRRGPWAAEDVLALLDRARGGGDPILLALAPGTPASTLEGIPGLRLLAAHAHGVFSAEVLGAPGRGLAERLIGLEALEVLAVDDRFECGGDAVQTLALESSVTPAADGFTELGSGPWPTLLDPVTNDPYYAAQWNLWGGPRESPGPGPNLGGAETPISPGGANVPPAWSKRTDASPVVVAVIDTGADAAHVDLAANLLEGERFGLGGLLPARPNFEDPVGHGTLVAGVIAAVGGNGLGISGVCQQARVLPLRAEVDGELRLSAISDAIYRAVSKRARVINMSFGSATSNYLLFRAVRFANDQKVLMVASAGNEGLNLDVTPRFPACYDLPNLLTVAALDRSGKLASFSNYGKETVDLAAPGQDLLTTSPGDRLAIVSGTSFSAPMVAAAAALIWADHLDRGPYFVRQRLLDYARQPEELRGYVAGRRQLDVGHAVRPVLGQRD